MTDEKSDHGPMRVAKKDAKVGTYQEATNESPYKGLSLLNQIAQPPVRFAAAERAALEIEDDDT